LAIAAAPLIYMAVSEMIIRFVFKEGQAGFSPLQPKVYNMLKIVLYALAGFESVLLAYVKSSLNSGNPSGIAANIFKKRLSAVVDDFAAAQAFIIFILTFCLSVSIYGLVLFLCNGVRGDSYPLMLLGALLCLLFIPTKENLEKMAVLRKV